MVGNQNMENGALLLRDGKALGCSKSKTLPAEAIKSKV